MEGFCHRRHVWLAADQYRSPLADIEHELSRRSRLRGYIYKSAGSSVWTGWVHSAKLSHGGYMKKVFGSLHRSSGFHDIRLSAESHEFAIAQGQSNTILR
jgi:hypothetical protein